LGNDWLAPYKPILADDQSHILKPLQCTVKLPRFALANLNVIGSIPSELKGLTLVEEMLVARCRAKMCIVKLQDH